MRRNLMLLAMMSGCGPASLSGQVSGESVGGARDAVYDTLTVDLGPFGDYGVALVVLTDFPEACEVIDAYSDAFQFDCEERCEKIVAVSQDYHLDADSYWSFSMTVNISDGEVGEFDYEPDSASVDPDEFTSVFSQWEGGPLRDQEECEDACRDAELFLPEDEIGEGGELEITAYEDEIMSGRFEVDLGGDDGLSGGFDATPCDTTEWIGF